MRKEKPAMKSLICGGGVVGSFYAARFLGGMALDRRRVSPHRMPLAAAWQRALARRHGSVQARRLMAIIEARYGKLYAERQQYSNRAVRKHLEARILPMLAIYQVLRATTGNQEVALVEVEELCRRVFRWRRQQIRLLHWLPDPFGFFRWIARYSIAHNYPPEGWQIDWIEDSNQRLAFDIRRCVYLDTISAHGVPELMPQVCRTDDWRFAALPPSISWQRTTTLGLGGDRCDFCWQRAQSGQNRA